MSTPTQLDRLRTLAAAAYEQEIADQARAAVEGARAARGEFTRAARAQAAKLLGEQAAALLTWEYDEHTLADTEAADAWLDDYARLRMTFDHTAHEQRFVLVRHCPCCNHACEDSVTSLADLALLFDGITITEPSPASDGAP